MSSKSFLRYFWISILFLSVLAMPIRTYAQSVVDLAVQYVEGTPKIDQIAYDVKVYLSVLDSAGNPVRDLNTASFTVTEDSQKVNIDSVGLVKDEPINIVLLIDTSGSMGGVGIGDARKAASGFVSGLDANDLVSVMTFDNTVKTIIDFTTDHKAASDDISLVNAVSGAGTCLYDAAYQAAQMTATVPAGRRAVVLLTDGVDEKSSGGTCSTHDVDNLVELATTANTRVPIYTLGMGNRVDEPTLKRIAADTGGRYLFSTDSTQLGALFLRLADQLRSEYVLQYTSVAGPGAHGLAVSVNYLNAKDTDTRNFLLPALPTQVSFTSPTEGQEVSGKSKLAVTLSGQGQTVESVAFQINGQVVGSVTTTPYQLDIDYSNYPAGDLTIKTVVYGSGNVELASKTATVKVVPAPPGSTQTQPQSPKNLSPQTIAVGGGGLVLLLVVAGVVSFTVVKRRQEERRRDEEWQKSQNPEAFPQPVVEDRTMDSFDQEPSPDALGMLVVENSDDPTMIGHRFDIMGPLTKLGRSADNDVTFPKDSPVSRHHAEIKERNGGLFFSEISAEDASGHSKAPTYGTFINDRQIGPDPVMLQTGDVIQLGKRVRMKFKVGKTSSGEERTFDGLIPDDDPDKTREE